MHFAYPGNLTNGHTFKFGFGPGAGSSAENSTDASVSNSRVRARQAIFQGNYFTSGGLDFWTVQNPDNYPYGDGGGIDPNTDYTWIYDQVACLMSSQMTTVGQYFQVYDELHQITLAAGAIAPFSSPDGDSAIFSMGTGVYGLSLDTSCDS
jgi:hypothetical protein